MHNPYTRFRDMTKDWKKTTPFVATLKYLGYGKGRSAVTLNFVEVATGDVFPMFLSVFNDLIKQPGLNDGPTFSGVWRVAKMGTAFSITPAESELG